MPTKHKAYGNIVEGPQGLHMPEATARAIEAIAKDLPKDFTYRRAAKAVENLQLPPGEDRVDVSYITTDAPDREDEVMVTKGMDNKGYNGVVTWCHCYGPSDGYDGAPVGKNLWIKSAKTENGSNAILAKTKYFTKPEGHEGPWMPDTICALQKQGALGGKSIGFIPRRMREASKSELAQRPEWKGMVLIDEWSMFEYAVAPVPCNPEAEIVAIGKSQIDRASKAMITKAMKELGVKGIADIVEESFQEAAENVAEMIPYYTATQLEYALMSRMRVNFGEEERALIEAAIVDVFDRAAGRV